MKQQHHRIALFYSYHQSDKILCDRLALSLRPIVREAQVGEWLPSQLIAGANVAQERKRAWESATHILLLLSADYVASDECDQEMREALDRQKCGKARIIPILLRPCLLPRELKESLPSYLPDKGPPVSMWKKRDEACSQVARDICQILGLPLASLRRRFTNRDRLLGKVFTYWIEGVLERSLEGGGAYLDLTLQEQPEVVNPWSSQVPKLRLVPHPSPPGSSIDQIYDHADGELLILGEPGAGKTTLLLELVRALLKRAEKDKQTHMPVVFHLSSWADKHQPLRKWLVEELWTKYGVPCKIGRKWIDAGQVIPLLDGLDEVPKEAQTACVKAINDYSQLQREDHGRSPLAVCCRSEEYAALSTHVVLQYTVSIQPLTSEQIKAYLKPLGEQGTALQQTLDKDTELRKLACQPLMLNFFTLAYQGVQPSEVPVGATPEKMRHAIFARYVEHMLTQRALKRWKQEQVIRWLTFLAKRMQRDGQTLFSLENLQPDWIPEAYVAPIFPRIMLFLALLVLFVGLFVVPRFGLEFGLFQAPFLGVLIWAGLAMLAIGVATAKIEPVEMVTWSWEPLKSKFVDAWQLRRVIWLVAFGLFLGLIVGLPAGLVNGLLFGFGGGLAGLSSTLWLGFWRLRRRSQVFSVVAPPLCFLVAGLIVGPPAGLVNGLRLVSIPLGLGLLFGVGSLFFRLVTGLFASASVSKKQLPTSSKHFPNEGIRRSVKNGLIRGMLGGLLGGLISGFVVGRLAFGWLSAVAVGLFVGLLSAVAAGLFFGLGSAIRHYILRFWLWQTNCLPWKLVPFLDAAVERLLLRKVGGSYTFVHQLLRDYLASQKASAPSSKVSSNPSSPKLS